MNLSIDAKLVRLRPDFNLTDFDCGIPDLNEFLQKDALPYQNELMGVTYLFVEEKNPSKIVSFFTISNDGLHVRDLPSGAKGRINVGVPREKQFLRTYPSVKIGRLGVNCHYRGVKPVTVGTQLMNFIKGWFIVGNKTGCKFILVDAYNLPGPIKYYKANGFKFIFSDELAEAKYYKVPVEKLPLSTRIMYFDLMEFM